MQFDKTNLCAELSLVRAGKTLHHNRDVLLFETFPALTAKQKSAEISPRRVPRLRSSPPRAVGETGALPLRPSVLRTAVLIPKL